MHIHSLEQSSPVSKAFKAFTTRLSYWSLCQMCSMKAASLPSNVMASIALNSNTSGVSRVQSVLSSAPFGWSACPDRVSGLPICLPGLWVRVKSNLERYRDHHAWRQCSVGDSRGLTRSSRNNMSEKNWPISKQSTNLRDQQHARAGA